MIATSMNRPKLKLTIISLLITLIFNVSCKKENNEQPAPEVPQEKWTFIHNQMPNQKGHFHEDRNGVVAYRNGFHLYVFDNSGKQVTYLAERIENNLSEKFPFMKNGSYYVTSTTVTSDYIFLYWRTGVVNFSRAHMIDIKRVDSASGIFPEYTVYSIQPDMLSPGTNSNAWAYAYKAIRSTNGYERMVLINLVSGIVASETILPADIPSFGYRTMTISRNGIVISGDNASFSLNRFREYLGFQNSFQIIPQITLFDDFIVKNANGFHTSTNGLTLKSKINGLPAGTEILHSRDSFLYISSDLGYSTFNAITGQEVRRFDFKNEKMPISMDSAYVVDYYSTRNGISYLVTNKGIVVAK